MSGTGKSSIMRELNNRGYEAYGTDEHVFADWGLTRKLAVRSTMLAWATQPGKHKWLDSIWYFVNSRAAYFYYRSLYLERTFHPKHFHTSNRL
jgi:hypothetical protein